MNGSIFTQASSYAGYAALAGGALQIVATQGLPTNTGGWFLLVANVLAGLAAIFKSEAAPPVVAKTVM